jgi:hypothetical protein
VKVEGFTAMAARRDEMKKFLRTMLFLLLVWPVVAFVAVATLQMIESAVAQRTAGIIAAMTATATGGKIKVNAVDTVSPAKGKGIVPQQVKTITAY